MNFKNKHAVVTGGAIGIGCVMKKTVKDIVSIIILILNILCLTLNGLMALYGISIDNSLKNVYSLFFKTNIIFLVDFIENNCLIWILCMFVLFIVSRREIKKSKVSFILSIINLGLSPLALLIYIGRR